MQGQLAGLGPEAGPHSPGASTCRLWDSSSPRPTGSGASQPVGSVASHAKGHLPSSQLVMGPGVHLHSRKAFPGRSSQQLSLGCSAGRFSLWTMLQVEGSPRRDQRLP